MCSVFTLLLSTTTTLLLVVVVVNGAPVAEEIAPSSITPSSGDVPLFIQQKYRQLLATCYKQTQQSDESCRSIYAIPARRCQPLPPAKQVDGSHHRVSCSFSLDGINTNQLFVVWTKSSPFLHGTNIKPVATGFRQVYSDPNFETFAIEGVSKLITASEQERSFVTEFELTSPGKESTDDSSSIYLKENMPFVFFFSQLQLDYLDLSSDDVASFSSVVIRRGVDLEGARQPPCKRSSLTIPVKWLLSEEQRARSQFVFPSSADIGTCSHLATKLGIDSCRLSSKDWSRAYDMFRIGLRHEFESNPANSLLSDKRRLLGEPSCVPAAASDFEYVVSELVQSAKSELIRYRVVTISKFVVSKCACF